MAYDIDVKTENLTIDTKRKISRITFYRSDSGVKSEALVDESRLLSGSGTLISNNTYLITTDLNQFNGIDGFGTFFNGYISLMNDLKNEYDASGSLATGSFHSL